MNSVAFQKALSEENRKDQIALSTLGSALAMILMPLGIIMDYQKYPSHATTFAAFRIASSIVIGLAWLWFHFTGRRHYRVFGLSWFAPPAIFILAMVYFAEDPQSPYYAGLNLVLLALGLLSPWTYLQNLISAVVIVLGYVAVSSLGQAAEGVRANNLFFLVSTATIVVAGSFASSRQRVREFQLRWELDQSRAKLEDSYRKLTELDQIKSRFFANISHELRTPLTLLLAPLETLVHRFGSSFDDHARNLLLTMRSNGMRLLKLINDLLDLVRLESGRIEVRREPVAVADFIQGLGSAARQMADDKRISLQTVVPAELGVVLVDRDKLEKVILNLVFNALKFTPAGGDVQVRAAKVGAELLVEVSDTGMGISAKNLPFIFDRFWQADGSSKRKYQGVGIGLALVKELTEIQGGRVTVESKEGKGTVFQVFLPFEEGAIATPNVPAARESQGSGSTGTVSSEEWLVNLYRRAELFPAMSPVQDAVQPVRIPTNGGRPTLLVADDEPEMLRFLRSQLSEHYEVLEAVDGQQAVDKAAQFEPDIILLDMMMPEKDGLQACKEIRGRVSTRNIPVLLLTARADEETKLAALSAGANDFLAKPFSTTELNVRVKNLVESYAFQRKLSKQNQVLESTIDQLKETETQLVQTEKLASLGRMSAGIIHEINNPLNFATTGLFALRKKGAQLPQEQSGEFQEILNDVEDGIARVKNIVCDLQTFSHPEGQTRDQVETAELIASALRFLSGEWKGKVRIQQELPPGHLIYGNRNKLLQVVINLLQNSFDALKGKEFGEEQPLVLITGRVTDKKSVLVLRDNGTGIAKEVRDKIFDPFFTTKPIGKGMGLGLAICYRIIQELDGRISLQTEPGRFCEFTLEFPRSAT